MRQEPVRERRKAIDAGPLTKDASHLVEQVYDRLRRVAATLLRTETSHTLPPTGLVHEAYMRLAENESIQWNGKTHFFRVAARQMNRILVDRGRRRQASQRSSEVMFCTPGPELQQVDKLALAQALRELAILSPRQAQVFKLRCLGGLTFPETARALSVSERTVKNDWTVARSWLARSLHQSTVE